MDIPSQHMQSITVILAVLSIHYKETTSFTMQSHDQQYIVDVGAQLSLRCEFYKAHFNLFDNPVQWKKSQYGEVAELNILGNVKEPFDSTGRFHVTYEPIPPRYIMGLAIRNLSRVDSGNYTCEVSAPRSTELGLVRYTVFVKAAVEDLFIVRGNHSSVVHVPSVTSITFIENEPTPVRCVARGGSPPPEMQISVGREDYTKYFRSDSSYSTSGERGLRNIYMTTLLVTDHFRATARDDGKKLKCRAEVPGSAGVFKSALIIVHYAPRIECANTVAYVGELNVLLTCNVMARPPVMSWFWRLDENGTTLSEDEVTNGFWTMFSYLNGKVQLKLYFRQIKLSSFRTYRLVATNSVGTRSADVSLKRKYLDSELKPHASTENKPIYYDQGDRSFPGASGTMHSARSLCPVLLVITLCIQ